MKTTRKRGLSAKVKAALAVLILAAQPDRDAAASWAAESDLCRNDCARFIDQHCIIDDTQGHGDGSGVMPFRLWPAQRDVVATLTQQRMVIILKARQLGISWICCAYVLWRALFQAGQNVLLFSQGETEAVEMLRRVVAMYERLPDDFKAVLPALTKSNTTLVEFANGSRVRSMPATPRAGRSLTASVVVMDEAAHMMWGENLYTAAKPTMDGGGQLIMLSTANGVGGLFHSIWVKAVSKINDFVAVFLPWSARPGRDDEWYAKKVAEETDPAKIKQEYPANPTEAFLASGRTRFNPDWTAAQAGNAEPGIEEKEWPAEVKKLGLDARRLTLYRLPEKGRAYVIGADVAEGLEGGDYSTFPVLDRETREEVAQVHCSREPDEFAAVIDGVGRFYNNALASVERNNHGHAVLAALKALQYPAIAKGLDKRPGWLSNVKTKPHSIDILGAALRDGLILVRTQAALDEMRDYRVLGGGKTGAPEGMHDDRVMAWAIALATIEMVKTAQPGMVGRPVQPLQPRPMIAPAAPIRRIPGAL